MLEAYALGTLTEAEMLEVTSMAAKYPEIKAELTAIELSLEQVAQAQATTPSSNFEENLMSTLGGGVDQNKISENNNGKGPTSCTMIKVLAGILGLATLAACFWAYNLQTQNRNLESALQQANTERGDFAAQYDTINDQLNQIRQDLYITTDQSYTRVALAGTDNAPQASSIAYWNPETSQLYLAIGNLQELAQDQQYQLWAIIDGKPVDAGVFDLNDDYLVKMKNIDGNVAIFAVTIEQRGGSPSPTLSTMQVAGNL